MSDRRKRVRRSLRYALFPGYRTEVARERVADLVETIDLKIAREWPETTPLSEHVQSHFAAQCVGRL